MPNPIVVCRPINLPRELTGLPKNASAASHPMYDRLFFLCEAGRASKVFDEVPEPALDCDVAHGLKMAGWLCGLARLAGQLDLSAKNYTTAFHTAPYEDVLAWFEAQGFPIVHVEDLMDEVTVYELVSATGRAVKNVRWRGVQRRFDVAFTSVAESALRPNVVCLRREDGAAGHGGLFLPVRTLETDAGLIELPQTHAGGAHRLRIPPQEIAAAMKEVVTAPAAELKAYVAEHGIDARDENGRTLLLHATEAGKLRPIKFLVSQGADLTCTDKAGRSALGVAAQRNVPKGVANYLIEHTPLRGESGRMTLWDAFEERGRLGDFAPLWERYRAEVAAPIAFEERESPVRECVDPLGAPILNAGSFTQAGWIPEGHAVDGLDSQAVDAARALAEALAACLEGCSPLDTEASSTFAPFYIPCLGREITSTDLALATKEALAAASGAYKQMVDVQRHDHKNKHTLIPLSPGARDDLDSTSFARIREANALAAAHLSRCVTIDVYPDFVTFPTLYGGLDEHFNFVGVITQRVWT